MEPKQLDFINSILTSNKEILDYLNNELPITKIQLSPIVKAELICLYFSLNDYNLPNDLNEEIEEILNSNNFTVEDNYIVYQDKKVLIDDIITIIHNNQEGYDYYQNNIYNTAIKIYIPNRTEDPISSAEYVAKQRRKHSQHLIKDEIVLGQEIRYLERIKNKNRLLLSTLITKLLSHEDLSRVDFPEVQYLFGITNTFMVLNYLDDKINIPYEKIDINIANTCINKMVYDEEYINKMDNQLNCMTFHTNYLNSLLNYYKDYVSNSKATIKKIELKLAKVMKEQFELGIEMVDLKHSPEIFNKHFINYLIASLNNGTFEYNNSTKDPMLSFFDLEGYKLKCYFEIHLSDFIELINNENIYNYLNNNPKLKKVL